MPGHSLKIGLAHVNSYIVINISVEDLCCLKKKMCPLLGISCQALLKIPIILLDNVIEKRLNRVDKKQTLKFTDYVPRLKSSKSH